MTPADAQTPQNKKMARSLYAQAFEAAQKAKLDYLAMDSLHMMVFVDTEPKAQLAWTLRAQGKFQEAIEISCAWNVSWSKPAIRTHTYSRNSNTCTARQTMPRERIPTRRSYAIQGRSNDAAHRTSRFRPVGARESSGHSQTLSHRDPRLSSCAPAQVP